MSGDLPTEEDVRSARGRIAPWVKRTPTVRSRTLSDRLGTNVYLTMLSDFLGCEMAKTDPVLAKTAMFSSDYPHSTTLWPYSKDYIAKMTAGMTSQPRLGPGRQT